MGPVLPNAVGGPSLWLLPASRPALCIPSSTMPLPTIEDLKENKALLAGAAVTGALAGGYLLKRALR